MSAEEPVGTLAEEAARVVSAVRGWIGESADEDTCRWCPLCRAARLAQQDGPELGERLSEALTALLALLRPAEGAAGDSATWGTATRDPDGAGAPGSPGGSADFEHIDVTEE